MNASTLIIIAILVVAAAFAGRRTFQVYFGKKGCCEKGPANPRAKKFANVEVEDRDESHYPHRLELKVGGMTCENCTRAVENAVNGMAGTWASADLGARRLVVRSKQPIDRQAVESLIDEAGYYVIRQPRQPEAE